MDKSFAEQLLLYQSNVLPPLLEKLSQQLHVSMESLAALEIGYVLRNNCWAIPERDEFGDVIGISYRQWDGKKHMYPGSKRGLIYVPYIHHSPLNREKYQAGPQNWERVTEEYPCAICGSSDSCLNSSEAPADPKAVMCCRVAEGAQRELGAGFYLHIRKVEGEIILAGSVLLPSTHPLVIVEGATDVAAARDIGLIAVGRPSSLGCLDKLSLIIGGRDVIVLGENDAGPGKAGMEKTVEILKPHARRITYFMPPEGIKDLRQWVAGGLIQSQFLARNKEVGDSIPNETILPSIAPMDLAKQWLRANYYQDDIYTLRVYHGLWYAYAAQCYREVDRASLRQQIYQYFGKKQYRKIRSQGFDILPYEPTKRKVDEIIDALLAYCPIKAAEIPCWLIDDEKAGNPKHVLTFPNGFLDIEGYAKRGEELKLQESTPHFFSLACYPYDFNPHATCRLWKKFLNEIFVGDPVNITLLQEWFGYNLIPDNSHEKFMMFLGPTRAGKGTILDVLTCILGEDQVLATSFRDYTRRFAIFPFLGKLAAVIGDVAIGASYDAAEALNLLKRITGNDIITIERKGRDITQTCIKLYTRFTMAANIMPELPDFARTIESRMLVIPFLISYAGREDITLKTRLKTEAPGILLWALEGLRRLQKNQNFTLPKAHHQILQRIRGEITPFTEFVADCCTLGNDQNDYVLCRNLYDSWKQWAIRNGEKVHSVKWLHKSLCSLYTGCSRSRRTVGQRREHIFWGIKLRPEVLQGLGLTE